MPVFPEFGNMVIDRYVFPIIAFSIMALRTKLQLVIVFVPSPPQGQFVPVKAKTGAGLFYLPSRRPVSTKSYRVENGEFTRSLLPHPGYDLIGITVIQLLQTRQLMPFPICGHRTGLIGADPPFHSGIPLYLHTVFIAAFRSDAQPPPMVKEETVLLLQLLHLLGSTPVNRIQTRFELH